MSKWVICTLLLGGTVLVLGRLALVPSGDSSQVLGNGPIASDRPASRLLHESQAEQGTGTAAESKPTADSERDVLSASQHLRPPSVHQGVVFQQGLLSVEARNRPLRWLMEAISRETGVPIFATESLPDAKMSRSFRELPLEEGIRAALGGYDLFVWYSSERGSQGRGALAAVWVYASGEGSKIMPTPAEVWASTREMEEDLHSPEAEARARAVETLVERQGEVVLDKVLPSLNDPDVTVRLRTLVALLDADVAIPPDVLVDLAQRDTSPAVRSTALRGLAGLANVNGETIRGIAENALSDADPAVAQNAQGILDQFAGKH